MKSDRDRVIRVRLIANWCSSRQLCELFNRMTTEGNYEWRFRDLAGAERRLRITSADDDEPDYWAIINAPPATERETFDRSRTVVFHMEPLMWTERMRPLWGRWAAPSPLSFLQVRDHRRYRNCNDWWVGQSYSELRYSPPPRKDRTLAACVSTKYFDPGHVRRIDFLRFLDGQDLDIDIYGSPENGFRRWRCQTPPHDKRQALLPYRYYFDAENNATPNYFTEKIVDCLLAETLCFYWGAPNLDSFFDPRAFIRLDLEDFEADLARIREAIAADEWSARIPYIRAEKRRILDEYQFFPTLARAIDPVRRSRRWHAGGAAEEIAKLLGDRRCGTFVEISDRTGVAPVGETLDAERRLDWSGLCLESDLVRARATRRIRECTIAHDGGAEPFHAQMIRNGLDPLALDWLNLATSSPDELVKEGGRLDLERVRANLITMPAAPSDARLRAAERLGALGYAPPNGQEGDAPLAMVREARHRIFGFYHLCTLNIWREVLAEQTARWADSGLLGATTTVFASVVGASADEGVDALAAACEGRLQVIHRSEDPLCYERPILEFARRFCKEQEPLARACWYMHAKGVSDHRHTNPYTADWRRMMEHFVVDGWRECVTALEDHDAVGPNWHSPPYHFSGNFWWATPRYLATLPPRIGPGYTDPEDWVGLNQPRIRILHESGVSHYVRPYPPDRYLRPDPEVEMAAPR
jgi:hypothetical protein